MMYIRGIDSPRPICIGNFDAERIPSIFKKIKALTSAKTISYNHNNKRKSNIIFESKNSF